MNPDRATFQYRKALNCTAAKHKMSQIFISCIRDNKTAGQDTLRGWRETGMQ